MEERPGGPDNWKWIDFTLAAMVRLEPVFEAVLAVEKVIPVKGIMTSRFHPLANVQE
jgi:hypothetical protein